MLADLDLLLCAVFCTADDLLPEGPKNARRARIASKLLALAASVRLNHLLGRPTRSFADLAT